MTAIRPPGLSEFCELAEVALAVLDVVVDIDQDDQVHFLRQARIVRARLSPR